MGTYGLDLLVGTIDDTRRRLKSLEAETELLRHLVFQHWRDNSVATEYTAACPVCRAGKNAEADK